MAPARRTGRGLAWLVAAALGVAVATGCEPVPTPPLADMPISDAGTQSDAVSADGMPACVPACLSETSLRVCPMDGSGEQMVYCPAGCVAAEALCREIVFSNGVTEEHLAGVWGELEVADGAQVIVDTGVGSITVEGQPVRRAGEGVNDKIGFFHLGESLSVFSMSGLVMNPGSRLQVVGERPLVILVRTTAKISGTIDVSAGCRGGPPASACGGPGGGDGADTQGLATGCGPGGNGGVNDLHGSYGGGGGGGSGQPGAAGGAGDDAAGGSGGDTCGASLVPLRGGSGGGRSGFDDPGNDEGDGGGGGGAVQIMSLRKVEITAGAVIDAGGGGGRGGPRGGGGGGGGGAILLEAPIIKIDDAVLAANGGGGGGAFPGEDGRPGVAQAQGGASGGGLGGAFAGAPTPGTARNGKFGGGGGGAAGLIVLRALAGDYRLSDITASPAPVQRDLETR